MLKRNIFLGIVGLLCSLIFVMGLAIAQVPPKPETEPVWVKVVRLSNDVTTVYYDENSLSRDKQYSIGTLLYIPDIPATITTTSGEHKVSKSRITNMVVDCKTNIFGIIQIHFYDIQRPYKKDTAIDVKVFEPPMVGMISPDSAIYALFCGKPQT